MASPAQSDDSGTRHGVPGFACALMAGVLLCGLVYVLVRVPTPSTPPRARAEPWASLELPGADGMGAGVFHEQAALFDTGPLFLPTRRNSGRAPSALELSGAQAPTPFADYEPRVSLGQGALEALASTTSVARALREPEALLSARHTDFFAQFGRRADVSGKTAARAALLRVTRRGQTMAEVTLGGVVPPALSERLWAPVDFLVMVGTGGNMLGAPLALGSTGDEAADEALREWVRTHVDGDRLGEGHFRVRVMP